MPKAVQYQKGSIIYFENDKDERIFILQKGLVILTTTDFETNGTSTTQLNTGEFFGVKSALGHFPREETATVLQDASVISMTVPEFEAIFSNKKDVVYKMLRVFSGQLREIHKKTKALLASTDEISHTEGMVTVAKCFFKQKKFRSCMDVCVSFLKRFPDSDQRDDMIKLFEHSKKLAERAAKSDQENTPVYLGTNTALAHFMLPAFERFQKQYENDQVIICEYEPGDSFYLIQSGGVQLVKCLGEDNIKNLDILKPGEFFGEMAILDNSPRSATCIAKGPVQCLEFNKANFEILVAGNPQIAIILLKLFCKRIFDQRRRLRILTIQDPQTRLADVFCMYDEMNTPVANEKKRRFDITKQDVAQWSGLPMEIVDDELNKWAAKNRIEIFDKYMLVSNISEMRHLVEIRIMRK